MVVILEACEDVIMLSVSMYKISKLTPVVVISCTHLWIMMLPKTMKTSSSMHWLHSSVQYQSLSMYRKCLFPKFCKTEKYVAQLLSARSFDTIVYTQKYINLKKNTLFMTRYSASVLTSSSFLHCGAHVLCTRRLSLLIIFASKLPTYRDLYKLTAFVFTTISSLILIQPGCNRYPFNSPARIP